MAAYRTGSEPIEISDPGRVSQDHSDIISSFSS